MMNWIHKHIFYVNYKIVQDHYMRQRMGAICETFRKIISPISNREDLLNLITNVSPIETHFWAPSKAILHEWGQPWEKK